VRLLLLTQESRSELISADTGGIETTGCLQPIIKVFHLKIYWAETESVVGQVDQSV